MKTKEKYVHIAPRHIGWQIRHVDGDRVPRGFNPKAIHTYNTALTFVFNAWNRSKWRLRPIFEGDIPGVEKATFLTAPEALKLVQKYNKEHEDHLNKKGSRRDRDPQEENSL